MIGIQLPCKDGCLGQHATLGSAKSAVVRWFRVGNVLNRRHACSGNALLRVLKAYRAAYTPDVVDGVGCYAWGTSAVNVWVHTARVLLSLPPQQRGV